MTLSIEVLPAPFGPMMARISRWRISRLMSVSALTPPKDRLMCSARSTASPMRFAALMMGSARPAQWFHRSHGRDVVDGELGLERALAAVLEGHLGRDLSRPGARIERIDQLLEALADEAAAHLARARELAVIGVELLVQDEKAVDLRAGEMRLGGEIAIDPLDAIAHEIMDRREAGQFLVAAIGDAVALGPAAHRIGVDVDE